MEHGWTNRTGRLVVSADRRRLAFDDGEPFLYLGDTGWSVFQRLTREEAEDYLRTRSRQGFTVIQAVALAEMDGLRAPNRYGHLPLVDCDPTRPDPSGYWDYVDWVIECAARHGLYVALLPTWGDKVVLKWGAGPVVFTPDNAAAYGRWLGKRYARADNLLWVLGGDRYASPAHEEAGKAWGRSVQGDDCPADDGAALHGSSAASETTPDVLDVWRSLARGLQEGDGGKHLITYHPQGPGSSADAFHEEPWLAFDMLQTGHACGVDNPLSYRMVEHTRALQPTKPVLDGEPRYESIHFLQPDAPPGWYDDADTRQAAYWSLLAGACGQTYGCHGIWNFEREPPPLPEEMQCKTGRKSVALDWRSSLELPGARQFALVRKLLEAIDWFAGKPCKPFVEMGGKKPAEAFTALACPDCLAVYFPWRAFGRIRSDFVRPEWTHGLWLNPATGDAEPGPGRDVCTSEGVCHAARGDRVLLLGSPETLARIEDRFGQE